MLVTHCLLHAREPVEEDGAVPAGYVVDRCLDKGRANRHRDCGRQRTGRAGKGTGVTKTGVRGHARWRWEGGEWNRKEM
jgi:hypothetical protein